MIRHLSTFLALLATLPGQAPVAAAAPSRVQYDDVPGQDARRYDLKLEVDLAARRLRGIVDYEFAATAALADIRLDARRSEHWHVDFTMPDGAPLPAAWTDDHVVLTLPAAAAKGDTVRFRARLDGTPVDGFYFEKSRDGEPIAFTDHYSIRARGWLPCEDNPGDRARFSLQLTWPAELEAIAFGVEQTVPEPPPAGFATRRFTSDQEIPPYMWALVVGPFVRVEESGDPRLVPHFVYRRDRPAAQKALVHHAQWLQTMEKTFGPYSYGKYTTVQCPTRWGGFEAPGNVQLAESLFDGEDHGTSTLAHELVHMWFGDAVGYSRWREVWLSEGFASYFGPWLHEQAGGPSLQRSMQAMRERWRQSFEGRTKSVRDDRFAHPDLALNSNTYPKGAWVLHMLRSELGDEKFFAALSTWYRSARGTSVTTADFVAVVEKSSGQSLGWFFSQWLDRVGCPELRVAPAADKVIVEQTQKGDPYTFWLRLRWRDDAGKQVEQRVRIDAARHELDAKGGVHDLAIDPDVELLFRPIDR